MVVVVEENHRNVVVAVVVMVEENNRNVVMMVVVEGKQ